MKIGCLHAHYSNIEYIEASIGSKADQIKWITQSGVDAILITCTGYIAILEEVETMTNLP